MGLTSKTSGGRDDGRLARQVLANLLQQMLCACVRHGVQSETWTRAPLNVQRVRASPDLRYLPFPPALRSLAGPSRSPDLMLPVPSPDPPALRSLTGPSCSPFPHRALLLSVLSSAPYCFAGARVAGEEDVLASEDEVENAPLFRVEPVGRRFQRRHGRHALGGAVRARVRRRALDRTVGAHRGQSRPPGTAYRAHDRWAPSKTVSVRAVARCGESRYAQTDPTRRCPAATHHCRGSHAR